jgi:hypothetical protein|tara:strand:+ start:7302 stop:7865 length:564 start_codon:yes stop_codon:yes gene_type:complete
MKSPFYFIAEPSLGRRYSNTKDIGGVDFIISSSEEDASASNRRAIVKELPIGYEGPIKEGDTLLVHHNVFKFYNDMKGRRKSGKSFFKEDLFFIDNEQFYMYHNGTEWNAHDRYCFVSPVLSEDSYVFKPFTNEPLVGVMRYPNEYLMSQGVKSGSKVTFTPESEYEFEVDGEKMYRIFDHQITLKL